jgi:hypothetical protein
MYCMKLSWPKFLVLSISLLSISVAAHCQDLRLSYLEFKGNKVLVHYSLNDSIAGRRYTVRLYSSNDNFLNPLQQISGDVGLEVKPGVDNKIVWNAGQELGASFQGKLSLEIRGRVFIPFINTESINQYKVFKRGRKYNITWSGGSPQNVLNFELYRKDRKVAIFPNIANVGHHTIEFSNHIKPGKGYVFKISDFKNKEDLVYSEPFRIKRRIPLFLKVIPLGALAYGVSLIVNQDSDSGGDDDIPLPNYPTIR